MRRPAAQGSRRWPTCCSLPALVLFGVFSFYPFLRNFKLMLYETPPVPGLPAHYVGLHQIVPTITSTQFTQSLVTTVIFVVLVVPISLILGLALAVAAHRKLKGMAAYRMIFSSTVVSSVAVASVVFGTLLNPVVGLLPWLGINPNPPALESTTWALPVGGADHHLAVPRACPSSSCRPGCSRCPTSCSRRRASTVPEPGRGSGA